MEAAGVREDRIRADKRAQRLVGTVHGTVVAAGVLAVSGGADAMEAVDAGIYLLATVAAFWLAHAWGHALGLRAAGHEVHGLWPSLLDQLPVLQAVVTPLGALAFAKLAGASDQSAINVAIWACVGALALLGAGVARREGLPPHRVARTAFACGAIGLVMVALKAVVH